MKNNLVFIAIIIAILFYIFFSRKSTYKQNMFPTQQYGAMVGGDFLDHGERVG